MSTTVHPPPSNAGRRFPPEVLTDAEVRALLDACGEGLPSCARNRALIAVLYRGGLRVSEALALYPKDLEGPGRRLGGGAGPERQGGAGRGRRALTPGRSPS
jgi:site-specific recombinase XerD